MRTAGRSLHGSQTCLNAPSASDAPRGGASNPPGGEPHAVYAPLCEEAYPGLNTPSASDAPHGGATNPHGGEPHAVDTPLCGKAYPSLNAPPGSEAPPGRQPTRLMVA